MGCSQHGLSVFNCTRPCVVKASEPHRHHALAAFRVHAPRTQHRCGARTGLRATRASPACCQRPAPTTCGTTATPRLRPTSPRPRRHRPGLLTHRHRPASSARQKYAKKTSVAVYQMGHDADHMKKKHHRGKSKKHKQKQAVQVHSSKI